MLQSTELPIESIHKDDCAFEYHPKELNRLLQQGEPNEIFTYMKKLILFAYTKDVASLDLPSIIHAPQFFYTHQSLIQFDANSIQSNLLLDILFLCKNSNDFSKVKAILDSNQTKIFLKLSDLSILKKIKKHVSNKTNPEFSKDFMRFLTGFYKERFNLLGYSILSMNPELFIFLLSEDIIDPKIVGNEFKENLVQWLLLLCCKDDSYYSFYSDIKTPLMALS